MNIKKVMLKTSILAAIALMCFNCTSNEVENSDLREEALDFESYKIDFGKSFIDLSKDNRFKDLTQEEILKILDHYSPGEVNTAKANCSNCVHHVRGFDNRLMPVDSGCPVTYKWTNTGCLGGKKKLINTCTPSVGSAVIMDTGITEGHVAYVQSVVLINPNPPQYAIKINEGNRPSGTCRTIWISSTDSEVLGYQNPNIGINCSNTPFYTCSAPFSSCN
ncbi:hypothetical protein [uncultured Kordia sp.]|uniref:hypothetical protein n=1 Tax=uncultured Kordia sp. TaxID=507699 RepID=UPI00262EF8A4|nr:hypothetical protein [uncultured Kordia sp.]